SAWKTRSIIATALRWTRTFRDHERRFPEPHPRKFSAVATSVRARMRCPACSSRPTIRVLGKLAQRTQALFFTHHLHLVEIARATLGQSVSVITLSKGNSGIERWTAHEENLWAVDRIVAVRSLRLPPESTGLNGAAASH